MKRWIHHLPIGMTLAVCGLMLLHGPIAQLPNYHDFADQSVRLGVPHFCDVISNLGFAMLGLWGWYQLAPASKQTPIAAGWPGYRLFLLGLLLTAVGSAYYHLAPDNARLVWDRLPIALACAGLLAAVKFETAGSSNARAELAWLAVFAVGSVAWWYATELQGQGDLRPYLLLQVLPLVLIPLWQWIHRAPAADRRWFGAALALYVLAKAAEVSDHQVMAVAGWISGHTLKHLLATAAAGVLIARLVGRVSPGVAAGSGRRLCVAASLSK